MASKEPNKKLFMVKEHYVLKKNNRKIYTSKLLFEVANKYLEERKKTKMVKLEVIKVSEMAEGDLIELDDITTWLNGKEVPEVIWVKNPNNPILETEEEIIMAYDYN